MSITLTRHALQILWLTNHRWKTSCFKCAFTMLLKKTKNPKHHYWTEHKTLSLLICICIHSAFTLISILSLTPVIMDVPLLETQDNKAPTVKTSINQIFLNCWPCIHTQNLIKIKGWEKFFLKARWGRVVTTCRTTLLLLINWLLMFNQLFVIKVCSLL